MNEPHLTAIFFSGANSLDYLQFATPETVSYLEFSEDHLDSSLLFTNLRTLVCNEASKYQMNSLLKFATGQVGLLVQLRCNLSELDDTDKEFSDSEVDWFDKFFAQLTPLITLRLLRKGLRIFFHNIEIDLSSKFDSSEFAGTLIEVQSKVGDRLACEFNESVEHAEFTELVKHFSKSEVLQSKTPNSPSPDPAFRRFTLCYNSIQSVSCSNYWYTDSRIDPNRFLDFLDCCVSLTSLNVLFCRFHDAFYARLVRSPCVFSLIRLCIMEPTTFPQQVDLNFLANFKHLKILRTNIATRQMIAPLAVKMNHRAEFQFDFYLEADVDPFTRCTVRRREENEYRITTVERNNDDFKCMFDVLTEYFDQLEKYRVPKAKFFHWLECFEKHDETSSTT